MSGLLLGDRYRLDDELGRGGMATVWRGLDVHLDRAVAVKVLDRTRPVQPAALQRLHQEAAAVAQLDHPSIVGVHNFVVDDDVAYLVMELVDGRDLAELLATDGPLPVDRAVAIAEQVCGALNAAHAAGVVHRDIKPGNLLISRTGEVKVCDFGIARLQARVGPAGPTAADTVVGTCEFMAPEQATGEPVDARTDLYGLGCVLYTMLVGRPPFVGDNAVAVLHQHLHQPPPLLSTQRTDVPAALDQLVRELLAKDPADRPANADVLHDRLAAIRYAAGQSEAGRLTTVLPAVAAPQAGAPGPDGWSTEVLPGPVKAGGRHREPSPLLDRLREWWITVAAGAAIVVTLVTVGVVLAAVDDDRPTGAPPPQAALAPEVTGAGPEPTPTPSATARTPAPTRSTQRTPTDWPSTVAAAIQQQVDAGQLDPEAGRDLLQWLGGSQADKHGKGVGQRVLLRKRLAELRREGELTEAGYDALLAATSGSGRTN